jgi:hypothetical protein
MTGSEQVAAILLKQVKEHPEHWNWDLKYEVVSAMVNACSGEPTRKR